MPRLPRVAIARRDLLRRLRRATDARLTLIVAAAGSGKSVLLVQLATTESDRRVAWMALEPADADASHLARHLLQALREVSEDFALGLEPAVARSGDHLGAEFLTSATEAMAALPETLLIIDDANLVGDQLHTDLTKLVRAVPPNIHVVISTRVDPSASFVRLEVAGEVERFEQADLALTADEEAQLVERVSGVALDRKQSGALHDLTEGWAAASQVAALALRGNSDVDAFLERYRGNDRELSRYLTEEVFGQEDPDVQDFLLRTSVVDRFNADLCAVLTGRPGCQEVLDDLDRRSLLVVRLDNWHEWFRYHHLFAEMLRARLHAKDPALERELMLAAASWHRARGDLFTTGELYVRAAEWDSLWDLVLNHGWELQEQGYVGSTIRWTRSAPRQVLAQNQRAALAVATQARVTGNSIACDVLLDEMEAAGFSDDYAQAWADMLHCIGIQFEEPIDEVLRRARRLREWLATDPAEPVDPQLGALENPQFLGMEVDLSEGRAYAYLDLPHLARPLLERARTDHAYWSARIGAGGSLAHLEAHAGELRRAEPIAREVLALAQECALEGHEAAADAYLALGIVERERNHLDKARELLEEGGARAARNRRAATMAMHMSEMALLELAAGNIDAGLERVVDFRHEMEPRLDPVVAGRVNASEARLWLAKGRADRAAWLIERSAPSAGISAVAVLTELALGRVDDARAALDRWPDLDTPVNEMQLRLARALLLDQLGDAGAATAEAMAAVRLAEYQGAARTLIDVGPAAVELVRRCAAEDPDGFAPAILAAALASARFGPEEALTEREMAILQELASLESNREIAAKLFISTNTLKTHLRRIYRKLGAGNRREAVHVAVERGLID